MALRVHGVVWVGTRTAAFRETVEFFRDVLGVPMVEPNPDFAWGSLPDGSQVEIFGANDPDHAEFTTGPVAEFLVDNVEAALRELRAAGVEIVGEPVIRDEEGWLHFRAPDGNVYGLTNGPQYRRVSRFPD